MSASLIAMSKTAAQVTTASDPADVAAAAPTVTAASTSTPVAASDTPETAPAAPATPVTQVQSTALTTTLYKLTPPAEGRRPDLQAIKPCDLITPMRFSFLEPYFYDAATQEYWIFTDQGALMVHKTPRTVIQKKQARKLLKSFPTRAASVEVLGKQFNIPKSAMPMILDDVVMFNAVHDSIIVERVKESTGLIKFWEDKTIRQEAFSINEVYLQYVRPTFDGTKTHQCLKLYHCGNKVIYCIGCTGYHVPAAISLTSITYHPPRLMGQVTIPVVLAKQLLARFIDPRSLTLNVAAAYTLLAHCFNMVTFSTIPIAPELLVANLIRDSLFVDLGNDVKGGGQGRISWAIHFGLTRQLGSQNNAANAADAAKLVRAGVSVGLGIASMLGV